MYRMPRHGESRRVSAPIGLGMWIAYYAHADGGDPDAIVERCRKSGISWLAVKSGDSSRSRVWSTNAPRLIQKCHDAGIGVYSWNYSRPSTWLVQVGQIVASFDDGVDGHIVDAEVEWQAKSTGPDAKAFVDALRAHLGPDAFLAHAPMDYRHYHPDFPYSQFDALGSVMPQEYWTEHNDLGAIHTIKDVSKDWETVQGFAPVGVTYGKGTSWGKPPGVFTEKDLTDFLDYYKGKDAVSLYSYEAADKICWEVLEKRASYNDCNLPLIDIT